MAINITHSQLEIQNQLTRHLVILPTPHEDVLRLKEKLLTFHNRGWQVRDFGAFGAFEWGFILIEIEEFEGYSYLLSLLAQGLKTKALKGLSPSKKFGRVAAWMSWNW